MRRGIRSEEKTHHPTHQNKLSEQSKLADRNLRRRKT